MKDTAHIYRGTNAGRIAHGGGGCDHPRFPGPRVDFPPDSPMWFMWFAALKGL